MSPRKRWHLIYNHDVFEEEGQLHRDGWWWFSAFGYRTEHELFETRQAALLGLSERIMLQIQRLSAYQDAVLRELEKESER